jgi:hypothetical protein
MEPTFTVKAEAGAAARSGRAKVVETVSKAALRRLFMAGEGRKTKKKALKLEKR